ncbi:MAG: DUF2975 domain-containing protein [Hyphomonadaceae bacterium]
MKALGRGSLAAFINAALGVIWVALWFAAGILCLAAIGYAAAHLLAEARLIDPALLRDDGAEIQIGGEIIRREGAASGAGAWPAVVPALLAGAVIIAGALIIVWRLRRLFESFSSGEPFRRENADHLRAIWITLLAMEAARYAILTLTGALVHAFGPPPQTRAAFTLQIELTNWLVILILIVLAEIFREGARLREEEELTI